MAKPRSWPARVAVGFGRFWWDFLVGDTPEITVAVVVALGLVALLVNVVHARVVSYVTLPSLCVLTLAWSVARARRRREVDGDEPTSS